MSPCPHVHMSTRPYTQTWLDYDVLKLVTAAAAAAAAAVAAVAAAAAGAALSNLDASRWSYKINEIVLVYIQKYSPFCDRTGSNDRKCRAKFVESLRYNTLATKVPKDVHLRYSYEFIISIDSESPKIDNLKKKND